MRPAVPMLLLWLPACIAASVEAHSPHVHGQATVNLVQDGDLLTATLDAPGASLVGFERPPRDQTERAAHEHVLLFLRAGSWIVPEDRGACALESSSSQATGFDHAHASEDGSHHDHDEAEETSHEHAAYGATITWRCRAPLSLKSMSLRLFDAFPPLERVDAELALPGRQGSQVVTAESPLLRLDQ